MAHALKIGDILRCSWGYDQTNIDFYEVTKATAKQVEIVEIESEESVNKDQSMTGVSVPRPGTRKTEPDFNSPLPDEQCTEFTRYARKPCAPMRRTVKISYDNKPYVDIKSYSMASLFEPTIVAGIKVFQPSGFSFYG